MTAFSVLLFSRIDSHAHSHEGSKWIAIFVKKQKMPCAICPANPCIFLALMLPRQIVDPRLALGQALIIEFAELLLLLLLTL